MEANQLIVKIYFEQGLTIAQILKIVKSIGINKQSIYRTINWLMEIGSVKDRPRSGRPRSARTTDRRQLYNKHNGKISLKFVNIKAQCRNDMAKAIGIGCEMKQWSMWMIFCAFVSCCVLSINTKLYRYWLSISWHISSYSSDKTYESPCIYILLNCLGAFNYSKYMWRSITDVRTQCYCGYMNHAYKVTQQ